LDAGSAQEARRRGGPPLADFPHCSFGGPYGKKVVAGFAEENVFSVLAKAPFSRTGS
jgi:hypothetical protein